MPMYDPKFSVKQMYDNYGSSRSTPKTNANKQAADSMRSAGIGGLGGRATTSSAQRIQDSFRDMRESSRTSGGTSVVAQDNNPNRDELENKSTLQKLKEKTINLFESFGADEPEALIVDNKRVYQGPLFRGYDPTTRIGQFGGEYGKKNYLFGIEKLGIPTYPRTDVSPFLPPSTINMFGVNTDNPRLNTFGVNRGSTQPPNMADLSVSPEAPANMDPLTRSLSQAMLPTPSEPTAPYTIRDGDTLSEIAEMTGTTVEELAEINNIEKVDEIDAGAVIDIPIRRKPSGLGAKPRPDVTVTELDDVGVNNPQTQEEMLGTDTQGDNVDFDFIGEQEGEGINTGYVPTRRNGNVIGNSGVTVGTGVDLGSKNDAYFAGLDESLKAKLRPHYGKRKAAAQASLRSDPLNLTDAEVDALDRHVKEKELDTLRTRWNQDSDTDFDDLPTNQATAVASTYYHHGNQMFGYNYWTQATSGDWQAAADNLRDSFDRDPIFDPRRQREADYLESGDM